MSLGFIILRHVNSELTDKYWKFSYECIKKFYPESNVLIIDDNSDYNYVDNDFEKTMINTNIVNSKYKGRGELLPYIYYLENKHCECVCILHDSVFVNKKIDLYTDTYKILWNFEHIWDQPDDEIKILKTLMDNEELLNFHSSKSLWTGCFGGMTVINYNFLKKIDDKYKFVNMIPYITTRYNRQSFERVIATILQKNSKADIVFGIIHNYCPWEKVKFENIHKYTHLPFIKIWTGR